MSTSTVNQWSITSTIQDSSFDTWVSSFLLDRKAQNMAKGTLYFYEKKLELFTSFCQQKGVESIFGIDSILIREYLLHLETSGHNPGGIHACYRALKTFLNWWQSEVEPENWKNPIAKVKAPMNPNEVLDPVNITDVQAMMEICPSKNLVGLRDRAILFFLLDTGVRAFELININLEDIDLAGGEVLIKKGKGRKSRYVYFGSKTRKCLRAYLHLRKDKSPALWISKFGEKLSYWGLKMAFRYRASQAGVKTPEVHAFRRWFALTCLRAGTDVYSVQKMMGHADLQVLTRYLKQTNQDVKLAHQMACPVDNM